MAAYNKKLAISIHSARVGGDREREEEEKAMRISIHSARVGGDIKMSTGYNIN